MKTRFSGLLLLVVFGGTIWGEDVFKYGQPACPAPVLDKTYFVVCYDSQHKIPAWVGYALTPADLAHAVANRDEAGFGFLADTAVPKQERAANADYAKSSYDKGHMAPAADFKRSLAAMKSTFVLSNTVPQKHGVNAGLWKDLEAAVRALAADQGTVWVFSGPVFIGGKPLKTIGANHVAVPTHTFKVVLCVAGNGQKEMYGFLLPNVAKPKGGLGDYALPVDQVEKLAGRDFFGALPDDEEARLESSARKLPAH